MKIVFFGSESTGKTSLALQIVNKYAVPCCPEYVREYLMLRNLAPNRRKVVSVYDDILPMSVGQAALEASFEKYALSNTLPTEKSVKNRMLVYDTNIETNWIYSKYYFGKTPKILDDLVSQKSYDLYFLMSPDIEWVADGLRDSPTNREEMHNLFKNYLIENNRNFVEISGTYDLRFQKVCQILEQEVRW
jgi:nicotinamide riboside kinase